MSIPIIKMIGASSNSKKRKMKSAKFYGLQSFLQPGCPISLSGSFRDNVRRFLQECGQLEDYKVEGMPIWCTFLVHEHRGFVLPLYTFEECVTNSLQPLCDHCRCSGWSHHFVSKRKYHFIIPIDNEWNKPIEDGVLDFQSHILHGLIHCNGFGHLICINGIEGGSNFICGREVMDLWDRICTTLHSRKISVVDNSKKRKMDLRLLYGLSYGHTWFGRWDYKFCHGSFGVTKEKYEQALQILSTIELDITIQDSHNCSIKKMITRYRNLSDTQLVTIRDLFRFMLGLKFRTPQNTDSKPKPKIKLRLSSVNKSKTKEKQPRCRKFSNLAAKLDSRWHVRRLEHVANVVVDALKDKKAEHGNGMSRQEARDTARQHIGDTGLIDYVLKSMNNVIVGGYVVKRAVNSCTGVLEYSLQDTPETTNRESEETDRVESVIPRCKSVPGNDVYKDLQYLYYHLLLESDSDVVGFAVKTVMDSKNFTKEWPFHDDADEYLRFICRVIPSVTTELNLETGLYKRKNTVGEELVVPLHATIHDLKAAAETAMRDTYCIMENLKVREIVELEGVDDEEVIFGTLESGSEICVRGSGVDLLTTSDLNYEGGADNWVVNCKCGARDDDGERMVECDLCEVWQHTRCNGIGDSEVVPPLFMCYKCCDSIGPHTKQVKTTAKPQRNRRKQKTGPGPSTTLIPERQLLLEPYVQMGVDFFGYYYTNKGVLNYQHRLVIDPMNERFWDVLNGQIALGWLESTHVLIWLTLLLERCPLEARWTIFPDGVFTFYAFDWTTRACGSHDPTVGGKALWEVDRVFFPICENDHWVLGELILPTCEFYIYDTKPSMKTFDLLRNYGKFTRFQSLLIKLFEDIDYWGHLGMEPQTVVLRPLLVDNVPEQAGSQGDCGVFVCMFMERLASGYYIELDDPPEVAGRNFRSRMSAIYWGSRARGIM